MMLTLARTTMDTRTEESIRVEISVIEAIPYSQKSEHHLRRLNELEAEIRRRHPELQATATGPAADGDLDLQIKLAQLKRENLINKKIEEGDKDVLNNLFKKSGSNKSSGKSSRGGISPNVFNYGSMSFAAASPTEYDDNSKYFKLLQEFGKGYRFSKSGAECHIMSKTSVVPLFAFPYTKNNIRNACFLFMNEENIEALMATGKGSLFEDCSGKDSPPEFKIFD
mmetsp:Transcript_33211/g.65937  ORF Transcript_33211/g.65937 Transcript_33211/m.65937 type:complete len:225 (+) Transcript_33211:10-684(+)